MLATAGFTRIRLFFGIAFAAVILAAVYSQLSPIERAKEQKDQRRVVYAERVLRGIYTFYRAENRLPWTDDLVSEKSLTPLPFVQLADPAVGICQDKTCSTPGELSEVENSLFPPPADGFFVGRGQDPADPIYVCFVPEAEVNRAKTGQLWEIEAKKMLRCSERVDWQETSCFLCVQ